MFQSVVCLLVVEKISLGLFDLRQCACVGVEFIQSLKLGAFVHAKVVAGPFRKPPATQLPGAPACAMTKSCLFDVEVIIVSLIGERIWYARSGSASKV
jgi:hypothetical protein